mgnify:CR=1 FL=1
MKMRHTQFLLLLFTTLLIQAQPATPFQRGVNLSNWLQKSSMQEVDFSRYTYEDFVDIHSLGVDVIRLPVNLHDMSSGAPDYIVDPMLLNFLDQIIDWTEALGLHLIIDNHSFDDGGETTIAVNQPLTAIWPQLTEHFIERDSTLYFEIKNEPFGISAIIWDTIQQNIVNLIRSIDTERTLIVGPTSWNGYNSLDEMLNYSDNNLIYTFHFYDPFIFTHQGASWTSPSMEPLHDIPFPFGAGSMPSCPPELIGTWIQSNMAGYSSEGTVGRMRELIDIAVAFRDDRNVPIYCGEFGVYMANSDNDHRVEWYREVTHYLDSLTIGWTMWDYHGGFGLFEPGGSNLFDHDLNIPLVDAMGFIVPPQSEYTFQPDTVGFSIYDDFIGRNISADFSTSGSIELFNQESPRMGNYCLRWSGAVQYDYASFDFNGYRDLTRLLDDDYVLAFWIKGLGAPTPFDVRFVDTKTDVPEDHPWRMTYTLDNAELNWDGEWQYIQIPLASMNETGSWDGAWFESEGLFDWTAIDNFQLVAERGAFNESQLWLDDIRIVDAITAHTDEFAESPKSFSLEQNYPNPFNPTTRINYHLNESTFARLTVYDLTGKVVDTLISGHQPAGNHSILWDAGIRGLDTGIYFARLDAGRQSSVIKLLFLK